MADLTVGYMGLNLRNPIIVGSSGLTEKVESIQNLERNGAGGVVLKSLFEEEIVLEKEAMLKQMQAGGFLYPETVDYYRYEDTPKETTADYLDLIRKAKKQVSIPVIASINCMTAQQWTWFPGEIENAGADGLELNLFILPSDPDKSSTENEKIYFDIINSVVEKVKMPVALKISYYFSNLALSLRWVAMMADRIPCDLAASTGVHDTRALIKQLLAGAKAVQVVSAIYKQGGELLGEMVHQLGTWMDKHGFESVEEFRGRMSQAKSQHPAAYERVQFMKYFRGFDG